MRTPKDFRWDIFQKQKEQIRPQVCFQWVKANLLELDRYWGWHRLKKEKALVTKKEKGEQSETRSCNSLLCWWGESVTPKLSLRFLIHHCHFCWVCMRKPRYSRASHHLTSPDWSPFRKLQEHVSGAAWCLAVLIKAETTPEMSLTLSCIVHSFSVHGRRQPTIVYLSFLIVRHHLNVTRDITVCKEEPAIFGSHPTNFRVPNLKSS